MILCLQLTVSISFKNYVRINRLRNEGSGIFLVNREDVARFVTCFVQSVQGTAAKSIFSSPRKHSNDNYSLGVVIT